MIEVRMFTYIKDGTITDWKGNEKANWIKKPYWAIDDQFPLGHGEKSALLVSQYIKLNETEVAMIRWHMGFSEPKENYQYLSTAIKKYPAVAAIHTSDVEASSFLEEIFE
jgi:hypothetical protein